jgi:hypothetical protein
MGLIWARPYPSPLSTQPGTPCVVRTGLPSRAVASVSVISPHPPIPLKSSSSPPPPPPVHLCCVPHSTTHHRGVNTASTLDSPRSHAHHRHVPNSAAKIGRSPLSEPPSLPSVSRCLEMAMGTPNPSTQRVLPDKETGMELKFYPRVHKWARACTHRVSGCGCVYILPIPAYLRVK